MEMNIQKLWNLIQKNMNKWSKIPSWFPLPCGECKYTRGDRASHHMCIYYTRNIQENPEGSPGNGNEEFLLSPETICMSHINMQSSLCRVLCIKHGIRPLFGCSTRINDIPRCTSRFSDSKPRFSFFYHFSSLSTKYSWFKDGLNWWSSCRRKQIEEGSFLQECETGEVVWFEGRPGQSRLKMRAIK